MVDMVDEAAGTSQVLVPSMHRSTMAQSQLDEANSQASKA
jgi:hypothetical protein